MDAVQKTELPGTRLAQALAELFTEWPMGGEDQDPALATVVTISAQGGPMRAQYLRATEADALTEMIRSEEATYRNSDPNIAGPCGHCGGTGKPAGVQAVGGLQGRTFSGEPGHHPHPGETGVVDYSGFAATTVRYPVPCTDHRLIKAARDAVRGFPDTFDGHALIGLETTAISGSVEGTDSSNSPLRWDGRLTTLIYANGRRFPADLGDSLYDQVLAEFSAAIPAASWAHYLRVPLVKDPVGAPVLLTVDATSYGPYLGLPTTASPGAYSAYLFTRPTVCQIIDDLEDDSSVMTAKWEGDALRFDWTTAHDGVGGTHLVLPDALMRYPLGDLWTWQPCSELADLSDRQQAFALGCASTIPSTSLLKPEFAQDFLRGREEVQQLTLGRSES
jgi:hypothetical protein